MDLPVEISIHILSFLSYKDLFELNPRVFIEDRSRTPYILGSGMNLDPRKQQDMQYISSSSSLILNSLYSLYIDITCNIRNIIYVYPILLKQIKQQLYSISNIRIGITLDMIQREAQCLDQLYNSPLKDKIFLSEHITRVHLYELSHLSKYSWIKSHPQFVLSFTYHDLNTYKDIIPKIAKFVHTIIVVESMEFSPDIFSYPSITKIITDHKSNLKNLPPNFKILETNNSSCIAQVQDSFLDKIIFHQTTPFLPEVVVRSKIPVEIVKDEYAIQSYKIYKGITNSLYGF